VVVIFSKQKTDFIVLASFSKEETLARTVSHSHHRYYASESGLKRVTWKYSFATIFFF